MRIGERGENFTPLQYPPAAAVDAERAETADRIERDVKRAMSALDDEIRTNGSQIESYLARAEARLMKDDVRECLSPDRISAFETQLAELRQLAWKDRAH